MLQFDLLIDVSWLDPHSGYNPGSLRHYGDDLADNARGIYYADDLRAADKSRILLETHKFDYVERRVLRYRKVFIPSFDGIDWNEPNQKSRRKRAATASSNAIHNGMWKRSEFAWDADARSDIFGPFRHDCRLDMWVRSPYYTTCPADFHRDKHEYSALLRETHPTRFTLTGNRRLVKRTPDETFALSTHERGVYINPSLNAGVFRQDRLQRLLLHPKCGLISDPKWGQTKMIFPFGVYEAKGWAGDYKEARRQACAGAHRFLNMLDLLARVPGTSEKSKRYQTERSHDFQVFVFTSYGAHWHVLVGIKHPRLPEQHAGVEGLSKDITVSHRDQAPQRSYTDLILHGSSSGRSGAAPSRLNEAHGNC